MKNSDERLEGGCGEAIEDRVAIIKSRDDQGKTLYQSAETIFVYTFLDLSYASKMEETGFSYGCYLKFQRESIIEENTKVTDNNIIQLLHNLATVSNLNNFSNLIF